MKVIDQINGSALFAQSAYSASIATKDSLGRNITATYLTGINIPESATWNDTSNVVQSNSAQWGQGGGGTTYTSPSGTILINDNTLEATTSAITQIADTASINNDYFYVSSMPNYPYSTYKFKADVALDLVVASYGDWIYTENYETDEQGFATIPSTFNGYDLTVVFCEGVLSGIKPNVVELATKSDLPTYQYDISNKISAINGSAIAAGDEFPVSADEAIQYVQTNSATINDVNTSYQTNSGTFLTAHQAISAEEWNDCYDNVNTNSGAWGGSALPISAGPGINVNLVDNTLVFSNDETVIFNGNISGQITDFTTNEQINNFEKVDVYYCCNDDGYSLLGGNITTYDTEVLTAQNQLSLGGTYTISNGYTCFYNLYYTIINGSAFSCTQSKRYWVNPTASNPSADEVIYNPTSDVEKKKNGYIYKIVGINRK